MEKKILFVDDDENEHVLFEQMLKNKDYVISCLSSGKKCIESLEQEIPDLIFLDIMMPKSNGWEVYDMIRENDKWKDIPIIFITGRTDEKAKSAGDYLGDGFIQKPIPKDVLIEHIEKIFSSS